MIRSVLSFSARKGRLFLLAVVTVTAACGDTTQPPSPGQYVLRVSAAPPNLAGVLLRVHGEGIDFVRAGGLQTKQVESGANGVTYLIRGSFRTGDILASVDVENGKVPPEYAVLQLATDGSDGYAPLPIGGLTISVSKVERP